MLAIVYALPPTYFFLSAILWRIRHKEPTTEIFDSTIDYKRKTYMWRIRHKVQFAAALRLLFDPWHWRFFKDIYKFITIVMGNQTMLLKYQLYPFEETGKRTYKAIQ